MRLQLVCLDTDDCKYLRLSVFFHALNGQQLEVAGIPSQSKGWHGSDGDHAHESSLHHTGFFTSSEHFMVQEMFGVREKSVVRLNLITLIHIGFQTISKCLGYRDNPVTFRCFRGPDNIFTIDSLEGFADGDGQVPEWLQQ